MRRKCVRHSVIDHRERDVDGERAGGDRHERPVVARDQDRRHERDLDQRGQDREQREADQRGDAALAALDVAREAAGLPLQVEAQRQRMQVAEHLQRDLAHRALRHLREQELAQLGEHRRRQPQQAVGDQQRERHEQRAPSARRGCRRCCFSSTGTPTLATLASTRQASAASTRPLYSHRYGSSVRIVVQSPRCVRGTFVSAGAGTRSRSEWRIRGSRISERRRRRGNARRQAARGSASHFSSYAPRCPRYGCVAACAATTRRRRSPARPCRRARCRTRSRSAPWRARARPPSARAPRGRAPVVDHLQQLEAQLVGECGSRTNTFASRAIRSEYGSMFDEPTVAQ